MATGDAVLATASCHHMGPVYIADSIRKTRWRKGGLEYFVKWKGWPSRFNTWEPEENILDVTLIKLFEQRKARARQRKLKVRRGNGSRAARDRPRHPVFLKDGNKYNTTKKERATSKPHPSCTSLLRLNPHPAAKTPHASNHSPTVSDSYRATITNFQHAPHNTVTPEQKTESDRENKNRAPQLDCLRGIKFKLGWRYNRRQSTGELGGVISAPLAKHDVNALPSPPPGCNSSAIIPPGILKESLQEGKGLDYFQNGPLMEMEDGARKPPFSRKINLAFQELPPLTDCRDFDLESRRKHSMEGSDDIPAIGKGAGRGDNEADVVADDAITGESEHCDNIDVNNYCQNEVNNNSLSSCGGYSEKGIGIVLLREHNVWNVKSNTSW